MNESSFTRWKSDVRQGTTDRGSASIANSVAGEVQFRQRYVVAANWTQTQLDNARYQSETIRWRDMGTNVHPQRRNETYARPAPRPEAPTSPIWLTQRCNSVRDAFWLPIKQNQTLIMPIINHEKSGGAQEMSLWMKFHAKREKWRTPKHRRSKQRQHHQSGFSRGAIPSTCCFGCKKVTNTLW